MSDENEPVKRGPEYKSGYSVGRKDGIRAGERRASQRIFSAIVPRLENLNDTFCKASDFDDEDIALKIQELQATITNECRLSGLDYSAFEEEEVENGNRKGYIQLEGQ